MLTLGKGTVPVGHCFHGHGVQTCGIKHCVQAQVRGQLDVLRSACREVQGSQDFTSLLQAVLALGNHLNEGTHKGNASGLPILLVGFFCIHSFMLQFMLYTTACAMTVLLTCCIPADQVLRLGLFPNCIVVTILQLLVDLLLDPKLFQDVSVDLPDGSQGQQTGFFD